MVFETNKVLMSAKMGLSRMAQHKAKLEAGMTQQAVEAQADLMVGNVDAATRRAGDILVARREVFLMEAVQSAYRPVLANLSLISSSKKCPPELAVAAGVVCWSAERLQSSVPEFAVVRDQLLSRFGATRAAVAKNAAGALGGMVIPEQIVDAFATSPASDHAAVAALVADLAAKAGVRLPDRPIAAPAPAADHHSTTTTNAASLTQGHAPRLQRATSLTQHPREPSPTATKTATHVAPPSASLTANPATATATAPAPAPAPAPVQEKPKALASKPSLFQKLSKLASGGSSSSSSSSSAVSPVAAAASGLPPAEVGEAFSNAVDCDVKDLPVKLEPTTLTYGLGSRQAPVDEDSTEEITLTNLGRSNFHFAFRVANVGDVERKCTVTFEPPSGTVGSGKTATVSAKLRALCTSRFQVDVHVVMWVGHEYAKGVCAKLSTALESQLTTKLDMEELTCGDEIGNGAYGVVYKGEYRGLPVAIKVLKNQEDLTPEMIADFAGEVRMMEKLRHPAILGFVGAVHTRGHLAIVTELCPFGSLLSAMKKHKFSDELKVKCLTDCAAGMNFLHQSGIMHRDLKPDNLLLVSLEAKSAVVCKLSDFGTTRDVNRYASDMQSTKGIGTPMFMAPEVLNGEAYNRSADVYGYALIINIVFAESLPFQDENIMGRPWEFAAAIRGGKRPKVPQNILPECNELMVRCWAQNPGDRPPFEQIHSYMRKVLAQFE